MWTDSIVNPSGMTGTACTAGTAIGGFSIGQTEEWTSPLGSISTPVNEGENWLHVCTVDRAGNIVKSQALYNLDPCTMPNRQSTLEIFNLHQNQSAWPHTIVTIAGNVSNPNMTTERSQSLPPSVTQTTEVLQNIKPSPPHSTIVALP